jgi:hypothetical protein
MKNEKKEVAPVLKEKNIRANKSGKKTSTAASLSNIITSAVESVKAKSGRGLANEGTSVSYDEER